MNKVLTHQDFCFADYTPLLADSIQQLLSKGLVLEHKLMTVVASESGKGFFDPIANARHALDKPGIYQRNPIGGVWTLIGETRQMDDLAIYLAENTPSSTRYSLMVDLLERVSAVPVKKDESFFHPGR